MSPALLGPLCAFLSSITWAIGSSSYAKMTRTNTAFEVNLSRATFALPVFVLATFIAGGGFSGGMTAFREVTAANLGWLTLSMIASYALGDILFFWSTVSLGVPGSLAIASSYPVITALFGTFALGESLRAIQWAGLLIAVSGIIVVILSDPIRPAAVAVAGESIDSAAASKVLSDESETARHARGALTPWRERKGVGILLALATAICWAANTFAVGRGGIGLETTVTSAVRMALALILTSVFSFAITRRGPRLVGRATWKKLGWVFLVEAVGGTYFFAYGLTNSSLILGAVLTSLAPVLAVPVAVALRLERFSVVRTAGVGAVVAGLALL